MTIAGRNRARLVAICIAALILILSLISFVGIVLNGNLDNSLVTGTKSAESSGITEFILSLLRNNYNGYAVLISILAFPFLSLGFLIFVYFTFKKTHAIEISFFAMFTLCISFESIRLVFPLYNFSNIVLDSIANLSRLVYFFRLAGIMSIFMAGFFFIFFISFLICLSMPINNFYISRYFLSDIKAGHSYIYLFLIAALLACVNYFFVYITKNIKEYLFAALSLTGALIGYAVLLYTSSYTLLGIGLALFILGNLSFIKYIHSYHIWQ